MNANQRKPAIGAKMQGPSLPPVVESGTEWLRQFSQCLNPGERAGAIFASDNSVFRDLPTMRLRAFGSASRRPASPVLVVTPFTLHDAGIADLMRGHSLIEALREGGTGPVFLTDWKSADAAMRDYTLDAYIADINVAIDDLGGEIDVVGLCQGGWLALVHAARFPGKIRRLALAGAPIDTGARSSAMTRLAQTAAADDEATLHMGEPPVASDIFAPVGACSGHEHAAIFTLQRNPASFANADMRAIAAYEAWSRRSLELPAKYARETRRQLFAANSLAEGRLNVLGRTLSLRDVKIPIFTLCGDMDEIVPKAQTMAGLAALGTPRTRIRSLSVPCGHFALFAGARTLSREWRTIAAWLTSQAPLGRSKPVAAALHAQEA